MLIKNTNSNRNIYRSNYIITKQKSTVKRLENYNQCKFHDTNFSLAEREAGMGKGQKGADTACVPFLSWVVDIFKNCTFCIFLFGINIILQ